MGSARQVSRKTKTMIDSGLQQFCVVLRTSVLGHQVGLRMMTQLCVFKGQCSGVSFAMFELSDLKLSCVAR